MSLDQATVTKIARLARIRLTPDETEAMTGELGQILGFVEQLAEVATDNVPAMTSVVDMATPMRADVVSDGGIPDKVLANAPEQAAGFYVVPKVVE